MNLYIVAESLDEARECLEYSIPGTARENIHVYTSYVEARNFAHEFDRVYTVSVTFNYNSLRDLR